MTDEDRSGSPTATAAAAVLPLSSGHWTLDPDASAVTFTVRKVGIIKVGGRFTEVRADLHIGERAEATRVDAEIALASFDTGNAKRDTHVRSGDMLDVEKRPTLSFRATEVSGQGEDWTMAGDMTIGEVTRPVSFAVTFGGVSPSSVDQRKRAAFTATGEIRRGDFGLGFAPGIIGSVVKVRLDMRFVEPQDQSA
ncbi:YceI family protein [Streptomyces sp. NPDC004610]|uniref:YceI family protein n=1 Tax=unclassified Streptomyces TaxID=2593676 RepID=UPI0033AA1FAA